MSIIMKPGLTIGTQPTFFEPIIRRDTNTVIISLSVAQTMQLIGCLARDIEGRSDVRLIIEADTIYAKDME